MPEAEQAAVCEPGFGEHCFERAQVRGALGQPLDLESSQTRVHLQCYEHDANAQL
jgi:hypothetical protein